VAVFARLVVAQDGHLIGLADGGQAGIDEFKAAQQRGSSFELVITDLGMPNVDGRSVAAAIKSLAPNIPVILLTGWGHRLQADPDLPRHVDRVLSKPPKLGELRAALAQLTVSASADLRATGIPMIRARCPVIVRPWCVARSYP